MGPLIVKVFDQDPLSKQLIGCSFIDIKNGIKDKTVEFATNNPSCDKPIWYDLYL